MPALPALLAAHAQLLVIDAASQRVQVGILSATTEARWTSLDDEAGVAVFRCVDKLGVDLGSVAGFIFCEGPGSTLGIRTAAMAIRTWQTLAPRPAFAYGSLALAAHAPARPDITFIADARRDTWHVQNVSGPLRREPTQALIGPLATPEFFRHWTPLPAGTITIPYDVAALFAQAGSADLFRPTDAPDAFLHEEPSYATWTPQIHRAPVAPVS